MNLIVNSNSPDETEKIAEIIGRQLKGGEVIELISDLGGGKTRFVHGLARAIKSKDQVASPSFVISKLYKGQKLSIYHFDLYRLDDLGLVKYELVDCLNRSDAVLVIEWGSHLDDVLPSKRLKIKIDKPDDLKRRLEIDYPKELSYLVGNL